MKNIVKVMRFNDNKARLYRVPDGFSIKAGTMVCVEGMSEGESVTGVTVSDTYTLDGYMEKMVIEFMHFIPATLDNLKKVLSVYNEVPCIYPEQDAE